MSSCCAVLSKIFIFQHLLCMCLYHTHPDLELQSSWQDNWTIFKMTIHTHSTSFYVIFWFYELHAVAISQALNYSIRLLRVHSSKLKWNCEVAEVRDLCSNSQSPFTSCMILDETHHWSISNAQWDISCTHITDLLWSWNGLIYIQGLLP